MDEYPVVRIVFGLFLANVIRFYDVNCFKLDAVSEAKVAIKWTNGNLATRMRDEISRKNIDFGRTYACMRLYTPKLSEDPPDGTHIQRYVQTLVSILRTDIGRIEWKKFPKEGKTDFFQDLPEIDNDMENACGKIWWQRRGVNTAYRMNESYR